MDALLTLSAPSKWVPGNHYHVSIPDHERVEDSPHEGSRLRTSARRKASYGTFDLNGKTLEEVQREAGRIHLGEEFASFTDFDRCLQSWAVINHRSFARCKTSANIFIRQCRFGKAACKVLGNSKSSDHIVDVDSHDEQNVDVNSPPQITEEIECAEDSVHDKENVPAHGELTHDEQEDLEFDNSIRQMSQTARTRLPFVELQQNVATGKIHGMCAHHLRANVKKEYGKAAEGFFNATVYANTVEQFNAILDRLEKCTAKGVAAAAYIRKLDPKLYARHAFPLPRFGHVTSNPCEATNSGLLNIREYAPFKLLVEMWYYIQHHFNSSRRKAADSLHTLTTSALQRHNANLKTYGQFQVFDDCGGTARICTTTGSKEYLVTKGERPTCTCVELQEMCWPCEHMMAWEDVDGQPFSKHFHKCWRVKSFKKLYYGVLPSFLCNDILPSNRCWPPEIAVKRGRHRVVRISSGTRVSRAQSSGEDVLTDSVGNLYLQYPIDDDHTLQDAMPTPETVATAQKERDGEKRRKRAATNSSKSKCGLCGLSGHNRRTCNAKTASTSTVDMIQVGNGTTAGETAVVEELNVQVGNGTTAGERAAAEELNVHPVFQDGDVIRLGSSELGDKSDHIQDTLMQMYRSVHGYSDSSDSDESESDAEDGCSEDLGEGDSEESHSDAEDGCPKDLGEGM